MAYRVAPQASPDPNRYQDEQYAMRFQPQSQVRPSPSLPSMPTEHDFNRRPLSDDHDFEKPGQGQEGDFDEIYSQYTTPVLGQNEFTGLNPPRNPRAGNPRGDPRGGRMGVGAGGGRARGYPSREAGGMSKKKKRNIIAGVVTAIVVICAVAIPVGIVVSNNNAKNATTGSSGAAGTNGTKTRTSSSAPTPTSTQPTVAVGGADGSQVTTDLGATFTYTNKFGGSWAFDPAHPFDGSAGRGGQSQDYIPRIGEEWVWGRDRIHGVNLGGWLVTEPFIVPGLYEQYQNTSIKAIDEYTLSQAMGDDLADKMEEHYRTFITEEDFALIAGAGLNFVRIPLGFWAVETNTDEPYLQGVSWKYFLKAIAWGRKYGIRIKLDLHALPGSQNGWNHSGKSGSVNWMSGVMGIANAQRALETLRSFTQFISQPQYTDVVPLLGIVNEVQATVVGQEVLAAFYYQAYQTIRGVTGIGAGKGPYIVIHEGFAGIASWRTFLAGADRLVLDQHPYNAFGTPNTNAWDVQSKSICQYLPGTTDVQGTFGVIVGGEWSNAINDCGKWLNGVGSTQQYLTVGSCDKWDSWQTWDDETKAGVKQYAMSNMDALQNWFFWTWKIGVSTEMGYATSPFWHYKAGLENGWMPTDPREAYGTCNTLGMPGSAFNGTYPATATGADPAATIAADQVASHNVFPPTALGPAVGTPATSMFSASQISLFPTLTQTGSPVTLTASAQASGIDVGNGWANPSDSVGAYVTVAGCSYPDEYDATALSLVPTAVCTGGGQRKREGFYPRQTQAAK